MVNLALDDKKINIEIDSVGPELFKTSELVNTIKNILGVFVLPISNVPVSLCYYGTKPIDWYY